MDGVEVDIAELQRREELEGGLQEPDLRKLRRKLSVHHSLLRQQRSCEGKIEGAVDQGGPQEYQIF